ncbi:MAG TPA: FKBP-type peptidyl-prolyl cis-trans isomerase [Candidatus Dormibacteraeota bacterium]|jgi:peptidylprolyl isomerase|nr:FKBP-type peptidyl-prolyl cis-trans isomerase [Candidatus Dormibacteraeota bacterium]
MTLRLGALRRPLAVVGVLLLAACGSDALPTTGATTSAPAQAPSSAASCTPAAAAVDNFAQTVPLTTTADGLKYGDITVGTGAMPQKGQNVTVQYTGWLTNGCTFDSSRQSGRTAFSFVIGATPPNVISGWEEGLLTMRVGGKRRLVIPPQLGYGSSAQGPIPANATLVFDVQLLGAGGPSPSPT